MELKHRINVKKGQIIYHEGDLSDNMYQVMYGTVGIYTAYGTPEQQELGIITPGGYLNVISFLEARPRGSTSVALEDCVLTEITKKTFESLFLLQPAKLLDLMQYMSRRMLELEKAYLEAAATAAKYYTETGTAPADAERVEKHKKAFRMLSILSGNRE